MLKKVAAFFSERSKNAHWDSIKSELEDINSLPEFQKINISCWWDDGAEDAFNEELLDPLIQIKKWVQSYMKKNELSVSQLSILAKFSKDLVNNVTSVSLSVELQSLIWTIVSIILKWGEIKDDVMTPQDLLIKATATYLRREFELKNLLVFFIEPTRPSKIATHSEEYIKSTKKSIQKLLGIPDSLLENNQIQINTNLPLGTPEDIKELYKTYANPNISDEEKKKQKRRLISKYHPDRTTDANRLWMQLLNNLP
jgi:hypothetical protein